MTPTQEEDVLVKSIELIKDLTGQAPRGYVAPVVGDVDLDRRICC